MRGSIRPGFALLLFVVIALALSFGCGERIHGDAPANQPPRIALSAGPPEGDPDSGYRIHFYWHGSDPDGQVDRFQFLVSDDRVTGPLLIDEDIYDTLDALGYRWADVFGHDSIFTVTADSIPDPAVDPQDSLYFYGDHFLFRAQHTFFIRAVDREGLVSRVPAHRSFTATNVAPEVKVRFPHDIGGVGGYDNLPPDVFFQWVGDDSVGDGTVIDPDSTRFALLQRGELGLDNQNTGRMLSLPDSIWSPWRHWLEVDSLNPEVSGQTALLTGLTPAGPDGEGFYLFLVQAKDEAGAITSHYRDGKNLRKMRVVADLQPRLTIYERSLGTNYVSHEQFYDYDVAEGQPLNLSWTASAGEYGSEITGYRYGWDIVDLNEDDQWTSWSLGNTSSSASFPSGTHSFTLEARDFSGRSTRVTYRFFVVPFTMEFHLLMVDDYDNTPCENPFQAWDQGAPFTWGTYPHSNTQQYEWWRIVLAEFPDYVPGRDFFRVTGVDPVPYMQVLGQYRRVLWEVRETEPGGSAIARLATMVDPYSYGGEIPYDYLSSFLERGGELLLCGVHHVFAMLPTLRQMHTSLYQRKSPMAFLKYMGYSGGSPNESAAAVRNFLPWKHLSLDAVTKAVDANPRLFPGASSADLRNARTFWGLTGIGYTGGEQDSFPIGTGWSPPDTLRFAADVYAWFEDAGPIFNLPSSWDDPGAVHEEFGLSDGEIYNWDRFAQSFTPPVQLRDSQLLPMLHYIPADSTTRWGTAPTASHPYLRGDGGHYNESRYATGMGVRHAIGVVSLHNPDAPNVVLGFVPYYLDRDVARGLFGHILGDIMGMQHR